MSKKSTKELIALAAREEVSTLPGRINYRTIGGMVTVLCAQFAGLYDFLDNLLRLLESQPISDIFVPAWIIAIEVVALGIIGTVCVIHLTRNALEIERIKALNPGPIYVLKGNKLIPLKRPDER